MGAGPPKGNKNAEKWTFEKATALFVHALDFANTQDKTGQYKYDFIGEVARDLGYYKSLFTELRKKFPELKAFHRELIETLEANCFCNSKKGFIREATAIVNLKSNHKWKDRQDLTSKGQKVSQQIIVQDKETSDALKKLKE